MAKLPHCPTCRLLGPPHPTPLECIAAFKKSRERGVKKLRALKTEVRSLKNYIAAMKGEKIDTRPNHTNKRSANVIPTLFQPTTDSHDGPGF